MSESVWWRAPEAGAQPIRTRGYYRALKRGEVWATHKRAMQEMMNQIASSMYTKLTEPNAFFGMIDQDKLIKDHGQVAIDYDLLHPYQNPFLNLLNQEEFPPAIIYPSPFRWSDSVDEAWERNR